MNSDLMAYIERLELMAFFSGYPLVYAGVLAFAGKGENGSTSRWIRLLPFAYALTGTLFFGLLLKDLFPDYSGKHIAGHFQSSYLGIWALLTILFWIPAFSKKPVFSLLHSLVFFSFLLYDLYVYVSSSTGLEFLKNDMKIYTDSLLLNVASLLVVFIIQFTIQCMLNRKKTFSD